MARAATLVEVGGRELRLSNLDKVLYPAAGTTKADVIGYYSAIAPALLPHLKGRPVSLKRFPEGVGGEAFFQKNCPEHRPGWVETSFLPGNSGGVDLCEVESEAALVWLANLAALELHTYLFRSGAIETPTMMVFDLDPGPGVDVIECARVGLRLRKMLEGLGLESVAKTSGGKGLHLAVPLNTRGVTFAATKSGARAIGAALEREDPGRITVSMARHLRPGKVFIDWSQNDRHKTTVSVYSMRGLERPTVSTPVSWREVEAAVKRKDPSRLSFEIGDVLERVERLGDLAEPLVKVRQRLPDLDGGERPAPRRKASGARRAGAKGR